MGTEGLTNSFVWGDEGGRAGSGRPWGTTWLPSRGHAHHLHGPVSGGLVSWAGQTPLFCPESGLQAPGSWAQAGLGNLSSWLYLHGGGPGVVRGRALSGQRSSGLRQAEGSRLSTAPARLQTANGPPPRSEVPRPREPRRAPSGFRFLTAALRLIASFPTSDSAVSHLCSLWPLPFRSPQLSSRETGEGADSTYRCKAHSL